MATIRISCGSYVVLINEPHPEALGKFATLVNAVSFCRMSGLRFNFAWEGLL
jgi:hypothetical protein